MILISDTDEFRIRALTWGHVSVPAAMENLLHLIYDIIIMNLVVSQI